jgi:STE24 endopeptidase
MNIIIIVVIVLIGLFDFYVEYMNYRHRNQPIAENVNDLYNTEDYAKSIDYMMSKSKFKIFSGVSKLTLIVLLLISGFFPVLETYIIGITQVELLQTLLFVIVYFLILFSFNIPFDYYFDFVIEERFGFNKQTKRIFFIDQLKGFVINAVLFGILITLIFFLYQAFKSQFMLFIGVVFLAIVTFLLVIFFLQGWIARRFNKLETLEEGSLKEKVIELATTVGFEVDRIFIMDAAKRSTKLGAFFTGFGKTKEVVLFDTLVEKLDEEEILAVLAHELGHAKHKDVYNLLIRNIFMMAIYAAILAFIMTTERFFTDFGFSTINLAFGLILMTLVLEPVILLFGIGINTYVRSREYLADSFGAKHTSKEAMISALRKTAKESIANLNPHPLYVFVKLNHPTLSQRLANIKK